MVVQQQFSGLKKRQDFLRLRHAAKWVTPHFILQSGKHLETQVSLTRFGYTASKKVGNAVARNRAKRRMRALVRLYSPALALSGYDYVVIARGSLVGASFQSLEVDMQKALKNIHRPRHKSKHKSKK